MARNICTKDNPYTKERDKESKVYGWEHTGAHRTGKETCDCCEDWECSNCGLKWTAELPE